MLAWRAHLVLLSVLRQAGMNCLGLYITTVLVERLLLKDQSVSIFRDFSWSDGPQFPYLLIGS